MKETIEVNRTAIVPKGDNCLDCEFVDFEIKPLLFGVEGKITKYKRQAICRFFNQPLFESEIIDNTVPCKCYKPYKKCIGCLFSSLGKEGQALILLAFCDAFTKNNEK